MSGPGHDGPWSRMITYAPTIHALCGLTYLSNPPDRLDVGPGFSLNDHAAGLAAAVAVLAAIEARRRTGAGQHLDIAQMETGTGLIGPAMLDYFANGREAHPVGNADPFGQWCPNEVFRCGDQREVAITCRDDEDWLRLCDTLAWDIDDLAADAELGTVDGRIARAAEIDERLRRWCMTRTADAAVAALQANDVPAGPVNDAGDLMEDPQLQARDFWRSFDHAVFGRRPFDRFPGPLEHDRPRAVPAVRRLPRRAQLRRLRRAGRPRPGPHRRGPGRRPVQLRSGRPRSRRPGTSTPGSVGGNENTQFVDVGRRIARRHSEVGPVNVGARFSWWLARPSRASGAMKPRNS